jgi:hypothetical protein
MLEKYSRLAGAAVYSRRVATLSLEVKRMAESGCAMMFGTTGLDGSLGVGRGWGLTVSQDRTQVRLLLCRAQSEASLAHLAENPWLAITFTTMRNLHSMQLKGRVKAIEASTPEDAEVNRAWIRAFIDDVEAIGVPVAAFSRAIMTADTAIDVGIERVFIQTPGPHAGKEVR